MDARACMHSYCSALPPSQASSLLMLHVHVQKRPFSRPSIAENKNLALTCAPVSPHGAAGHKNQRRVLVWLFRSPPPPCQVSSRIGYGSCAASTVPLHSWRSCFFFLGGGGALLPTQFLLLAALHTTFRPGAYATSARYASNV